MADADSYLMDFAEVDALFDSELDPALELTIGSEVCGDALVLTLSRARTRDGREVVQWAVYDGLEFFEITFDEQFRTMDLDGPVTRDGTAYMITRWARLIESYFRGEGTLSETRTLIRRRRVRQLTLSTGEFRAVVSDR